MSDRKLGASARAILAFAGNLALLSATGGAAAAADASAWDGGPRAAMRLIAGARPSAATKVLRAGIEIKLGPGWKTYWRYPGDSGVPPRFRFDRSDNVAKTDVLFPAPHGFTDEAGETIGYKDDVILPVHVAPRDPAKPVVLRVDLDYAICEKLCIPIDDAKAELALPGDSGEEATLAASEARVPKAVGIGDGGALSIKSIRREDGSPHPRIVVDVAAPAGAHLELFAEGPTPEWSLPIPAPVTGAPPGLRRFAFELDGLPPGASAQGAMVRLTAVTADDAIEVTTRLK